MPSSKFSLGYYVNFLVNYVSKSVHQVGLRPMIRCFAIKFVHLVGFAHNLRGLLGLEEVERDCFGHSLNSIFGFYRNFIDQKCLIFKVFNLKL